MRPKSGLKVPPPVSALRVTGNESVNPFHEIKLLQKSCSCDEEGIEKASAREAKKFENSE